MISPYALLATLAIGAPVATAEPRREPPIQLRHLREPAPPPAPAPASVTLRQGVIAAHLAFEASVSQDAVLAPASVAPDLSYGVTRWLTLAVIHSGSAMTGFRGSAGWGACMTGTDENCRTRYAGGGVESTFAITRGSAAIGLSAGVLWTAMEPTVHTDLKLGVKMRLSDGNVFALFSPNVWLALDDRFDRVVPHEHMLWLPISVWVKPVAPLAVGVGTGVKGPLESFAERMSIPLGALVQYTIDPRLSVGSSFVFGKLLGGTDVMNAGIDARVVQVWINLASS